MTLACLLLLKALYAQHEKDWFTLDPQQDTIAGISLEKAFAAVKGRNAAPVIVAVIDNGVDIDHIALKNNVWTNQKEIDGNHIDDDKNGFADDLHGWNFRGGKDGSTIENEQAAALQFYLAFKGDDHRNTLAPFKKAKRQYLQKLAGQLDSTETQFSYNSNYHSDNLIAGVGEHRGTPTFKLSPNLTHGTHVAGIVVRIAPEVVIMPITASTAVGDERDKDVAAAIYYAVNNGARIINISFSKLFSSEKGLIDDAVRYAGRRNVLIIHCSGNDGVNIDSTENFHYPVAIYENGQRAENFITVGWSRSKFDNRLAHPYGDYGRLNVDLYAPGSDIWSTVPGNNYDFKSGSSMSAPVVTGIAALLLSYFPALSAKQLKEILMKSVFKPDQMVNLPQTKALVPFSSLSVSGGIVNAFNAVTMAMEQSSK